MLRVILSQAPKTVWFPKTTTSWIPKAAFSAIAQANVSSSQASESFLSRSKFSYEELLKLKKVHLNRSLEPYYKEPLMVSTASKQWIFDHNGKRYLDFFAGIATVSVGHCHPRLVKVLQEQSETLWHTAAIYTHPQISSYAKKLTSKLPKNLSVAHFVNSGSEANDLAMLLARISTGNHEIVALRNGYHGTGIGTMGLSSGPGWHFNVTKRHGMLHLGTLVDPYQGPYGGSSCRDSISQVLGRRCECKNGKCSAAGKYVQEFLDTVNFTTSKNLAAFVAEGIQGVGGTVQYPRGFINEAYKITRECGGVCISDEVQTGFGRLGSHFWGFQSHGVTPDIVVTAKGIGNGFPLAAVVTTPEVASHLTGAYFNTFGGNPLACAVGEEVLNIMEDENLQQNCDEVGTRLIQGLCQLREEFEMVGDVRGKGLMIGLELVENKESKKPLEERKAVKFLQDLKDLGLLVGRGGPFGNVLRVKPPMCITAEDVDLGLDVIRTVLQINSL